MKQQLILFCLLSNFVFAQKTITTYYDRQKTKKDEVYQTDVNGTMNGSSKKFDINGALVMEGTFKFGKKHGVFIKYFKFPNYAGTMQTLSKETYVNDVLEGIYVHYSYNEDLGVYEDLKGNYKQDQADGIWTQIIPLKDQEYQEYGQIKSLPIFKGSMAIKITGHNNGGVVKSAINEGKYELYYYPSNKIYYSSNLKNGVRVGEKATFYPDGKLWSKSIYDETGKAISSERYYYSGKLNFKEIANPYSYEGYNQDGTQDKTMIEVTEQKKMKQGQAEEQKKREQEAIQKQAEQLNQAVIKATEIANNGKGIYKAIDYLQDQISYASYDTKELKAAKDLLDKMKKQKEETEQQEQKIRELIALISPKHQEFEKLYVEKKEIPFFKDAQGRPTYKNSHPKGKHIYEKGEQVYEENLKLFNYAYDPNKKITIGNDTVKLLDKLILLASSDTKELDKALKKAETNEEVKKILGL